MKQKLGIFWIVLSVLLCFYTIAQPGTPPSDKDKKDKKIEVPVPASPEQARDVFWKAWHLEKEQQHEDALVHYRAVLEFYRKNKQTPYTIAALNNIGGILSRLGKIDKAVETFQETLQMSIADNNHKKAAEIHHKLGILLNHLAALREFKEKNPHIIYVSPDKKDDSIGLDIAAGIYTQLIQIDKTFKANYITLESSENPYEVKPDIYSKIIEINVKGDFDSKAPLIPDSVELLVQVRKTGYDSLGKTTTLLPDIEYTELNEILTGIKRQVKPEITEDFYKQGSITPDEITLTRIVGSRMERPTIVTEKETFKPGYFQLSVKKAGYNPIAKQIIVYPGEGVYQLPVMMTSKLRDLVYRIQSDFMPLEQRNLVPDEIHLNGQPIREKSKVNPGIYQLVIKKEGYEPIIENVEIIPEDRQYMLTKYMHALPREVIFHINGDYAPDVQLTPDEVTFENKFVLSGNSVRPDAYRIVVRKKGYDVSTDRVIIEPKKEPYYLKKLLISTPRRIDLNVTADFPPKRRIFPESSSLNRKEITTEESFKPGEYTLAIRQSGYYANTKKVNIAPDDTPYRIDEMLKAKPREIRIELSRDIEPEDPQIPTQIVLENEQGKDTINVASGDKVNPENYVLKIDQPGYDPDSSKQSIYPSEDPYNVSRRLIASQRTIVTKITAEYPPDQQIVLGEITLDNKPMTKDFKSKPGQHDLVILCEGYLPIREPIKILASPNEYILARQLETRTRLVNFVFLDSYTGGLLEPDEVRLRDEKIQPGEAQNLKPGKYKFSVRLSGYRSLDEELEIPVGVNPYKVERTLTAILRKVVPIISNDFNNEILKLDQIDVFTFNDISINTMIDKTTADIKAKPQKYTLFIQKKGFDPITKAIEIVPAPDPYEIKERLISKPRKLEITIRSSFPFAPKEGITPDILKLGAKDVKNGDMIKPSIYALMLRKAGHKNIGEQLIIEPAETSYILDRTMETMPRLVKYEINNDFDNQRVEPDIITINDQNIDQTTTVLPNKYAVKIEKLGFYEKKMDVMIEPSDDPYLIQTILVSMVRDIELRVTGDYPPNEIVDPEVAALNGKDVREGGFKPGKYVMEIQQPGFFPLKENLVIPPSDQPFLIERILVSTPRTLEEQITYDIIPPDELIAHQITLTASDNPTKEMTVKKGDKIKPNEYIMKITKEAYEPVEKKLYVWPSADPLTIAEELIAKQVTVLINITYDVPPPLKLADYSVSLIDQTNIPRSVKHGSRIKPGSYKLKIERPGYSFGLPKQIYIQPTEGNYNIIEQLLAEKVQISFDMVDKSIPDRIVMVSAHRIINKATGLEVTYRDRFDPGKEIELMVLFKKYKTVHQKFMIEPSPGMYIAEIPLVKLAEYQFFIRHSESNKPPYVSLDGVEYPYSFYVDGVFIEEHQITAMPDAGGKWSYTVSADTKAINLQAFGGYKFIQRPLAQPGVLPPFNAIGVAKLIEHLERINKMPGRGAASALEVMEIGLANAMWYRMLQRANPKEIESLMHYIETLSPKGGDEALNLRMRMVLDRLDKIRAQ